VAYPGDPDGSQQTERPERQDGPTSVGGSPVDCDGSDPAGGEPDAPLSSEPRARIESIPVIDVVLDRREPGDALRVDPRPPRAPAPARAAIYGALGGLGLIAATFAVLIGTDRSQRSSAVQPSPEGPAGSAASSSKPAPNDTPPAAAPAPVVPAIPAAQPIPGPWRVSQLGVAPEIKLVEGTIDRRSFIDSLNESGVPRAQVYRLIASFNGVRHFDKPKRHDSFLVALEMPAKRVRAFEYQAGPTEVYQAREKPDGSLVGERLDLHVEKKRAAAAVVVSDDLGTSLQAAGFEASLVDLLDDVLEGRTQLSSLHGGSRLRVVADYETALGSFARYLDVLAVEYLPSTSNASGLRVYRFHGEKTQGYFDGRGHQPDKGGFRRPIPLARISSGFNLRRMHPILHVIMPHNGVDFVAPPGTPVYAACAGKVEWIGDSGASGNLVTIRHPNGIITGYAHLSRFAPHLAQGQAVDTRQLVGYVGSTGRSTGPHLHFSAKKNGVFIDPMRLKLDSDRVLPKQERPAFDEQRAALDTLLDAIPLPPAPEPVAHPKAEEDLEPLEEGH